MSTSDNKSEVARLRQQIADEYEAMSRVMTGYSITSRHDFIDARMRAVDRHCERLTILVGKEDAMEIVIEVNNEHAPEQRKKGGINNVTQ